MHKIKNLIASMSAMAFISCSPQPALAQSPEYIDAVALCNDLVKFSHSAQRHRQELNDFGQIIALAEGNPLAEYVILQAYKVPLVSDDEKVDIVVWFSQETQKWCYNTFIKSLEPKGKGTI